MLKYLFLASFCLLQVSAFAATTATATITYTIGSIDAIAVSGNPGPLNVTAATAGSAPSSASDASTTYAVTTNNTARRITASLATNMPSGVTLSVALAAPTGATSLGAVNVSTTAATLVTGISNIAQAGLAITYTLTASPSAAQVTAATNTITYTIGP